MVRGARHIAFIPIWLASTVTVLASPYRGVVTFGGLPLPGATVTVAQDAKTFSMVTDQAGAYAFSDLADGVWTIDIEMQCFEKIQAEVTVGINMANGAWEMKLLPLDQLTASAYVVNPVNEPTAPSQAPLKKPKSDQTAIQQNNEPTEIPEPLKEDEQSTDGFLVQGSVNNAATSVFATDPAFGNTRSASKGLYSGGLAVTEDTSMLDARPFSLTGITAAKPAYNYTVGFAILQGPLRIPHLMPRGPNFGAQYQWTRNSSAAINTGLVPTQAERGGDLSGLMNAQVQPITLYDPATGQPYVQNRVPVSAQAKALLALYPQPNIAAASYYNYQAAVLNDSHLDNPQFRLDKAFGAKDQVYGSFNLQSTRAEMVNLFGFIDRTNNLGINSDIYWIHQLKPHLYLLTHYAFGRLRTRVAPNFANRENVSGLAGIGGNDQDANDWGPPTLSFSSGFVGLNDSNSEFNRDRSDSFSASAFMYRGKHYCSMGGELRKQEYNHLSQEDPRGVFGFTGAATAGSAPSATSGSDLADFLIGAPDTSSIAFGNADKYFRGAVYSINFADDWRVSPTLSINAGARWDYATPITELKDRLVNIDVSSEFATVAPVLGNNPVGPVSGRQFPSSLIRPDKTMFEPRIGIAWRPRSVSTMVIRAGYGIYPDTSVYRNIVLRLAQQAPLSKSATVQNSSECPLTLANGFSSCPSDSFGIDPNFHVGYAQSWNLGIQWDMPFAIQMTASYLGTKGTHGPQEILPNSYPLGGANPCSTCPAGFIYESSGGNSIRHAGQLQIRRRLRSGFAALLTYTYSKSIDDDAYLGGQGHVNGGQAQSAILTVPSAAVAQNWLNPRAERSLSSFDQRNRISAQAEYTSGQGLEGGTLLGGWRGRVLKEWTVQSTVTYGSGSPETPIYPGAVPGTGFTGYLRPDPTGAPIYVSAAGASGSAHLNAAAFAAPAAGQWGTVPRNSITGPEQFTLNSQLARTFRPHGKLYLDVAVNSTNTLNHPAFAAWNNYVTSTQFGLPVSPGNMRVLETTFHLRF